MDRAFIIGAIVFLSQSVYIMYVTAAYNFIRESHFNRLSRNADNQRGPPLFLWSPRPENQIWFYTSRPPSRLQVFSPKLRSETQTFANFFYDSAENRTRNLKKFLPLPDIDIKTKSQIHPNQLENLNEAEYSRTSFENNNNKLNTENKKENKLLHRKNSEDYRNNSISSTETAFDAVKNLLNQYQNSTYAAKEKAIPPKRIDEYEKLRPTQEPHQATVSSEIESTPFSNEEIRKDQISKVQDGVTNVTKDAVEYRSFINTSKIESTSKTIDKEIIEKN